MMITELAEREIAALMALHPKGYDLSLDRIARLLARLGNPQDRLPPIIHIAGTNGKGSASAFCRALLEAAGYRVHVHTSPHLVHWHERFRLGAAGGGKLVEDGVLAEAVRRVADANAGQTITVFEILTAVMFVLFSEHPADIAIVEVGLGGRFDATNVVQRPAASLIMPIAMDHVAYLGDRVELIAAEKAGIIKPGIPVVIGAQEQDAARQVLCDTAAQLGCPALVYGMDFLGYAEHGRFLYQDPSGLMDLPLPCLIGRHQLTNAAAAIATVRAAGFALSEQQIETGLTTVNWPARLQPLTAGNLVELAPAGAEIWLDGGHNPGAGAMVAEAMAREEDATPRPLILIAGMIDTKDQTGFFANFHGMARHIYTVPVHASDAGVPNDVLAARAAAAGIPAEPISSVAHALNLLRSGWAEPVAPRILICGSLYLAGEVLAENGTPPQ